MTNMRIISRLILQQSSHSCPPPRWVSTATEPKSRNTIFYRVVGASSKSGVVDVLNKWAEGGKPVKKSDIINLSNYFRSHKNFRAALQLYEWMDSSNLQISNSDEALRIDLLGRAEGLASAEKYFDGLQEKTEKTYGALLSCYCRERASDMALETFGMMKEWNYTSTLDYNNVLSLYYNLEKHEKVVSLLQEMEEKNTAPDLYTYNMWINSLAALKNYDAIEGVVEKMESSENFKPDLFTYGNLANIFFGSGQHEKAITFLELMEKMEGEKIPSLASMSCLGRLSSQPSLLLHTLAGGRPPITDPDFQLKISSILSRQKWSELSPFAEPSNHVDFFDQLFHFNNFDSNLIVSFFKWSQFKCKVSYSTDNYVKLFILLANEKKYTKIRSLLHLYTKQAEPISISAFCHSLLTVSDNVCANNIVFDMLILALVTNRKTDLAYEGFMRAGDYGFKLSSRSCNAMLAALVGGGRIGNVEFAYKEMVRRRIELNSTTFNTVASGLCKAGRLNKANEIVEDMSVYGVETTVATYNTIIDGYCKRGGAGRMYKADALLKKMVERGLSPNVITYNILIDGFCKDDNVAAGIRLLKEMKTQGLMPSVITYNTLFNGLCADGKIDEAVSLRDEMVGMGLEPNVVTHSVFINGYSKRKRLKKARELFNDIVSKGDSVNVMTFNTMINAYCRAGNLEEAVAIFNLMLEKNVAPIVSTYNCLIGAYYRDGNMEAADKLLNEMEEKGLEFDVITYNIRIDAMCKSGETRKAVRFLDEMFKKGLKPSHIAYNTLIDGYCKHGNLKAALTVKKRMEKERMRPNVVTYNVLVKAFSESGKLEEANRILNEMLEKGLIPNRITYDIIKEQMMEKGFVPDIDGHLSGDSGKLAR